jgi:hypothetical protein
MSTHFITPNQPEVNKTITPNAASMSTMMSFPFAVYRKDMSTGELTSYRYEWQTFERVWMYNYTVSTLNGTTRPKPYSPYQFINKNEQLGYSNGQLSHMSYYSTAGAAGQFNNIPY